ncbi:MAG TPA: DUF4124 domain-containing protein [Nevskiaceae bacterium]
MIGFVSVALLTACMAPVSHAATLYRWVDSNGQVHFSDQQRIGASAYDARHANEANSVRPTSAPTTPASASPAAHSAVDCDALRSQLSSYEKASSVTEVDALGQSHVYTAEQREQLVSHTRDKLMSACGTDAPDSGTPAAASSAR